MTIDLVGLLIFALVCVIVFYIISLIPLEPPIKRIANLIFSVVVLIVLIGMLLPSGGVIHIGR